jgi:acyl carrier protein
VSNTEIETKLLQYIGHELAPGKAQLEPGTSLQEVIDSTAVMELVVWIEDNYGFQVDLDDIEPAHFGSVTKLATYIQGKRTR